MSYKSSWRCSVFTGWNYQPSGRTVQPLFLDRISPAADWFRWNLAGDLMIMDQQPGSTWFLDDEFSGHPGESVSVCWVYLQCVTSWVVFWSAGRRAYGAWRKKQSQEREAKARTKSGSKLGS